MVNLILAENFFPPGDAEKYCNTVSILPFVEKDYGLEIDNFHMIFSGIEPIFSKVLGERIVVDHKRSGIFRKPMNNVIHFESFESLNEWCFIVALEKNTLNFLHHLADKDMGEFGKVDAKSALDGWKFNYRNLFEWTVHTNILLEPNQGIFFRPWIFHSLNDGLVQYYRLLSDQKFRVLVIGRSGSSRSFVAKSLAESINNSRLLRSIDVRKEYKDIDFTPNGLERQAYRILELARNSSEDCIVIDMKCPNESMQQIINADIVVWVDDGDTKNLDVNQSFVDPKKYDLKYTTISDHCISEIIEKLQTKRF